MMCSYSSLLVPMNLSTGAEFRAKLAVDLADRFSSHLIGVGAEEILTPLYFETPVEGIPSIIEVEERRAAEHLSKAEAVFRKIAGSRNNVEWRQAMRPPTEYVVEQARAGDLIVASRPQRGQEFELSRVDAGDLVMGAGRPVLFVPPEIDNLVAKHVIVAWKSTCEARRAVADSMPFLRRAKDVLVVAISDEDQGATDVAAYLTNHKVNASAITRAPSNAAVADDLISIASGEGSDLIVCGAYGHSRAREWLFGGVTGDLLDRSPLCLLMSH